MAAIPIARKSSKQPGYSDSIPISWNLRLISESTGVEIPT